MILDEIYANRRRDLARAAGERPLAAVERAARAAPPPRDFRAAVAAPGVSLIAETKKASPSKGVLIADYDPVALARDYEASGARAVSVLTEERYFQGSLEDLARVRAGVSLPCLRKDFLFDPYQVFEARAAGADAILLIVAVLEDAALRELRGLAEGMGMAALVEVHDEGETERALASGAGVIGVNNRDLRTFDVDLATTERLRPLIPQDRLLVGESGIHTRADVARLAACGVDAILVGESLVRAGDTRRKVVELLA